MNAKNIVSALVELLNNNLSMSTSSPVTVSERQMAEYLADTIQLVSRSQRAYYEEETTIDIGEMSNEDESDGKNLVKIRLLRTQTRTGVTKVVHGKSLV